VTNVKAEINQIEKVESPFCMTLDKEREADGLAKYVVG